MLVPFNKPTTSLKRLLKAASPLAEAQQMRKISRRRKKHADKKVPSEFIAEIAGYVLSVQIISLDSNPIVPIKALTLLVIHPAYPSTWMFFPIVSSIGPSITGATES
jgi:hypothetical protein